MLKPEERKPTVLESVVAAAKAPEVQAAWFVAALATHRAQRRCRYYDPEEE